MTDTPRFHRRSIRLRDYDYRAEGAYFVTICTHQRAHTFGQIRNGGMIRNAWGDIVADEWEKTAVIRSYVELDAFVVMPNHFHGILVITEHSGNANMGDGVGHAMTDVVGATRRVAPTTPAPDTPFNAVTPTNPPRLIAGSLGAIIGQFKSIVTKRIRQLPNATDDPIWQRNYHERILRNQAEYDVIRAYVMLNPERWGEDVLYTG